MEKYIPYEKLSKKRKREINAQKRGSWGGLNPVTRKLEHSKAYRRSKAGQWKKEYPGLPCFLLLRPMDAPLKWGSSCYSGRYEQIRV